MNSEQVVRSTSTRPRTSATRLKVKSGVKAGGGSDGCTVCFQ